MGLSVIGLSVSMLACATKQDQTHGLLYQDHVLTGKIWQVKQNRFVKRQELLDHLLSSEYLLLGETHDNQRHHEHQIWVIDALKQHLDQQQRSAAVMFEMINERQAKNLDAASKKSSDALIKSLNREKTGWNYHIFYKPLFDSVIKAGFSIYPANIDRDSLMKFTMASGKHIPDAIKATMDANTLSDSQKQSLKREIIESHCNMASDGMVAGMTLAQRIKDATMSNSLMDNEPKSVKVLIAGSGHVRQDRGIPLYIRQRHKEAKVITLAFVEVMQGQTDIGYYRQRWGEPQLPFDYIWFTPTADRDDPCEAYARYMKKKHSKTEKSNNENNNINK